MPLDENSVLQRFLVRRGGGGLHHVAYAVSDVRSASRVLRQCGVRVLYDAQEPVPAARKSILSTPRTLAAFFSVGRARRGGSAQCPRKWGLSELPSLTRAQTRRQYLFSERVSCGERIRQHGAWPVRRHSKRSRELSYRFTRL